MTINQIQTLLSCPEKIGPTQKRSNKLASDAYSDMPTHAHRDMTS